MDKQEIQRKAAELQKVFSEYKGNLNLLEKELLKAIAAYHDALKEEKLKEIRESVPQSK